MKKYIPHQGDCIALPFDHQSGHEQKGRRPALVVSKTMFNRRTGLAFVCPITQTERSVPLHIRLPEECTLSGVVMVEQMKSVDFMSRKVKFIEKAPVDVLNEALALLDAILYDD